MQAIINIPVKIIYKYDVTRKADKLLKKLFLYRMCDT